MDLRLLYGVLSLVVWNSEVSAEQMFDWTYRGSRGPSHWAKKYPMCGGSHQSPINIDTSKVSYNPNLKPFVVKLNQTSIGQYTVKNLGLNVEVFFEETNWHAYFEGYSEYCYRLLQIHFHWGFENERGSEHAINQKRFPLEGHFVMWNCHLYRSAKEAAGGVNGLAVMSVLFTVDDTAPENPMMQQITEILKEPRINQCPCETASDIASVKMKGFDVNQLLPRNRKDFYRYQGSLTTPPCTENVMWTIFNEHVAISTPQLTCFRNLKNRAKFNGGIEYMGDNFRPLNPLNPSSPVDSKRVVTSSFRKSKKKPPCKPID